MERAGAHPANSETLEARPHLARRPVGERHRQDRGRLEGPHFHLVGNATGDRRRLARAGTSEDADRPAHGSHGVSLLGIQRLKDGIVGHRSTLGQA
jgi:hypothetical protein